MEDKPVRRAAVVEVPLGARPEVDRRVDGLGSVFKSTWNAPLVALALGAFALVRADDYTEVSFNTMGPNDQYASGWGLVIATGAAGYGDQSIASQFKSATTGTIAKLFVPAFSMEGVGTLKVSLHEDASNLVGQEIESWTVEVDSLDARLYSLPGDDDALLESDTKYWLELEALPGSVAAWNMSDDLGKDSPWRKYGLVHGAGATSFTVDVLLPGLRIETAPKIQTVPESATLAALGLGIAALRRRKRA